MKGNSLSHLIQNLFSYTPIFHVNLGVLAYMPFAHHLILTKFLQKFCNKKMKKNFMRGRAFPFALILEDICYQRVQIFICIKFKELGFFTFLTYHLGKECTNAFSWVWNFWKWIYPILYYTWELLTSTQPKGMLWTPGTVFENDACSTL